MSGTGQPGQRAPVRLTPIEIDQPIVEPASGRSTPYFGQVIQRILAYLGQPGSGTGSGGSGGGGGSGLTITEQLNTLVTTVEILQATSGGNTRPPSRAPASHTVAMVPAAPQPRPNFAGAQMLSWWRS